MITLQISPTPSEFHIEHIRQLVGFYRGIATITKTGMIHINPKKDFHLQGLLLSLRSLKFKIDIVKV